MSNYSEIKPTSNPDLFEVTQVIVADADFIATLPNADEWLQTSYNTRGNKHYDPITGEEDSAIHPPLRGNYAGIGFIYDKPNDVFYIPSPYPSWILDKDTWSWSSPIKYPVDGKNYEWNEDITNWVEIIIPGGTPVEVLP